MTAASRAAVRIEGLSVVREGREILKKVSVDIAAGVVTGLLGPSGSGKTTLMRAVVGVQRTSGGSIEVLGLPAGHPGLRDRIGYLTQAPSVYFDLTVEENLRYFAAVLTAGSDDVSRVVEEVDLGDHAGDLVGRLSEGEKARVSLAVALLGRPDLVVLDEPTVGLDPILRRDLWNLFHQLADGGTTVLASSHVMDEAERCNHLLLLRDGQLIADGSPAAVLEATSSPDIEAAFLALVEGKR
jgi:ABC-2 type transport system ATP-binding protein